MTDPMTPSPEDVERMIERLRAGLPRGTCGYVITGASIRHPVLDAAADMLAALSAIGGDE